MRRRIHACLSLPPRERERERERVKERERGRSESERERERGRSSLYEPDLAGKIVLDQKPLCPWSRMGHLHK
jgi:hypothetical protein